MKEHHQGGRQYDKIAKHPQRRSRHKQDEPWAQDELDQEAPPLKKSLRLAREKVLGKHQERKSKKRKQRRIAVAVTSYMTYHFKRCREWEVSQRKTQPGPNH